jgi:hypothetical protein
MLGLTTLGLIHTAVSLVAVGTGLAALIRDREITPRNRLGQIYVVTTVIVCLTGFGIYQHGGFGKAHALGLITLVVLGLAALAASKPWFGRSAPYVETIGYSATFFFHLIPAFTETATRLPVGAPLAASPEAPGLQAAIGGCFVLFLIGTALQIRRLRAAVNTAPARAASTA